MGAVSDFWYEKKCLPDETVLYLRTAVNGEPAGTFSIGGDIRHLLKVNGDVFRTVFIENRKYLYRGDFTAPSDDNDYENSANYLSEDGLAGFSVTDKGWLVSLFSNLEKPGFARAVREFVIKDAYKLVCIVTGDPGDNKLVRLYEKHYGFRIYAATVDDTAVMRKYYGDGFIDGFVSRNGTPFHVFMTGGNAEGDGTGIRYFEDYFEAEAYVDETVRKIR